MNKQQTPLGYNLNILRIRSGLTVSEMAEKCGIARSTLKRLLHYNVTPSTAIYIRIVEAMGIPEKDALRMVKEKMS